MSKILILLIFFVIAVFALMIGSIWYMNFVMEKMIGKKHEWLEFILYTSFMPDSWSKSYNKKLAKYKDNPRKTEKIKQRANRDYIRRLDKLIRYVKVATLVDSEETRNQMLKSLKETREQWKKGDYVHDGNQYET